MLRAAAVPVLLLLAGCAGVDDLKAPRAAAGAEPATAHRAEEGALRRKADAALAERRYADAWNLEAAAGTDADRLASIAVASLEADQGPYEDMFAALIARFSKLPTAARARVEAVGRAAEAEGDWSRAVEVALVTAEDAPAYAAAWAVYERAPTKEALDLYRAVEKARTRHADAAAPAK